MRASFWGLAMNEKNESLEKVSLMMAIRGIDKEGMECHRTFKFSDPHEMNRFLTIAYSVLTKIRMEPFQPSTPFYGIHLESVHLIMERQKVDQLL